MAQQIGIRELRETLAATIRRVRNGETIEITHRQRPVAVLVPAQAGRLERLLQDADITPPEPLGRPLRRFPVTGALSASQALEEDRAER